jgi:hypothetical protein
MLNPSFDARPTGRNRSDGRANPTAVRILLADDHELVRDSLAAFLQASGFEEVEVAGTLEEAVTSFRAWEKLRRRASGSEHAGYGRARRAAQDAGGGG